MGGPKGTSAGKGGGKGGKASKPCCSHFRTGTCHHGSNCHYAHTPCRDDPCQRETCMFGHPLGWAPSGAAPQLRPRPSAAAAVVPPPAAAPAAPQATAPPACTHFRVGACRSKSCKYRHAVCSAGARCEKDQCSFGHPFGWAPAESQDGVDECRAARRRFVARRAGLAEETRALVEVLEEYPTAAVQAQVRTLVEKKEEAGQQLAAFDSALCRIDTLDAKGARRRREAFRLLGALPFYAQRRRVLEAVAGHNVTVIVGETGSGKSTQIAPYLLDTLHSMGVNLVGRSKVVVTQPRGVAARELAKRVGVEWGSPGTVGQVRDDAQLSFCTDEKLLNIMRKNPSLDGYACVIVDEVHERSVNTDLVLGFLKKVLARRPGLRVVLTSATIDKTIFREFFRDVSRSTATEKPCEVPSLSVAGRVFPIEDTYEQSEDDYVTAAWRKALHIYRRKAAGDILVFLATTHDIERACRHLRTELGLPVSGGDEATDSPVVVLPLHGNITPEETELVFRPPSPGCTKIVFSTSIAETSVTIDGVVHVVDSGMANVARFDPIRNMTFFDIGFVTQSSVKQRRGRAGRTRPGRCHHLYSKEQYEGFETTQAPEIRRTNLCTAVLKLCHMSGEGGCRVHDFDFLERPSAEALDEAVSTLVDLGALTHADGLSALTQKGRRVLKMAMAPEVCCMILKGVELGVTGAVLQIASLLASGRGVFTRSGTDDRKQQADLTKVGFCEQDGDGGFRGDLLTGLKVFRAYLGTPRPDKKAWCARSHVALKAVASAAALVAFLTGVLVDLGVVEAAKEPDGKSAAVSRMLNDISALSDGDVRKVRAAICAGYFKNVSLATGVPGSVYTVGRLGRTVQIHPSSVIRMMQDAPPCILYTELVKTSQYFVRDITVVDAEMVAAESPQFAERIALRSLQSKTFQSSVFERITPAMRREIVGPRGAVLNELEATLGAALAVEEGRVTVWAPPELLASASRGFGDVLTAVRRRLRAEAKEVSMHGTTTRAVIGHGCSVARLLMKGECVSATVRNLPFDFKWDAAAAELLAVEAGVGGRHAVTKISRLGISSDGESSWGSVECASPADLRQLADRLDVSTPRFAKGREIQVKPRCLQVTGAPVVKDTSVKVLFSGPKNGRPAAADAGDILLETARFAALWTACGVVENTTVVLPADGKPGRAFIEFKESAAVDVAVQRYHKTQDADFGGLAVFAELSCAYFVAAELLPRLTPLLEEAKARALANAAAANTKGLKISGPTVRGPKGASLKISAGSGAVLQEAKQGLDRVLRGDVVPGDCTALFGKPGKAFLDAVMARNGGVYIAVSDKLRRVTVYGQDEDKAAALAEIAEYGAARSRDTREHVKVASGKVLSALVGKYGNGLAGVQEQSGVRSISVNFLHHTLTITGDEDAIDEARELIKEKASEVEADSDGVPAPDACGVCLTNTTDYMLQECGCQVCHSCLKRQLVMYSKPDIELQFPLPCPLKCGKQLALCDVLNSCTPDAFQRICERSMVSFLSQHTEVYGECPTPNCNQVFLKSGQTTGARSCDQCNAKYCAACNDAPPHPGVTCQEYAVDKGSNALFQQWKEKSGGRACPKCDVYIQRNGGCDHMTCKCGHNFCYKCGAKSHAMRCGNPCLNHASRTSAPPPPPPA